MHVKNNYKIHRTVVNIRLSLPCSTINDNFFYGTARYISMSYRSLAMATVVQVLLSGKCPYRMSQSQNYFFLRFLNVTTSGATAVIFVLHNSVTVSTHMQNTLDAN